MDQFGKSRKRMRPQPKIMQAAREAVGPCHESHPFNQEREKVPNFRRVNEKRQAQFRKRHGGVV